MAAKRSFKYYQGKFTPTNPDKYSGDLNNIVYRSRWEKLVFKWLDRQPHVAKWVSEEVVVPYICETDSRPHRYFVDVAFTTTDGTTYLVEIKPERETKKPVKKGKKKAVQLREGLTYIKNQSKWKAAAQYAKQNGAKFEIWTEVTLKKYGIMKY